MLAYHNDKELKRKFVAEMKRHREQDMILQGAIGSQDEQEHWRGCHVACAIHSMSVIHGEKYEAYNHNLWETLLGVPIWMAHLCEAIFEYLDAGPSKEFPVNFSKAVRCGSDLNMVKPKLMVFMLKQLETNNETLNDLIRETISLWRKIPKDKAIRKSLNMKIREYRLGETKYGNSKILRVLDMATGEYIINVYGNAAYSREARNFDVHDVLSACVVNDGSTIEKVKNKLLKLVGI